ncbi:hypothetical protein B0H13DRAFT_2345450 [Mycena leptocephala]|nr:hypothetical protein B0H13DRAFT_2345450 [Mycena leptocephala]
MASDSNETLAAPLSDADALTLVCYGRDTMRDAVGVIAESVLCSAYGIFFAFAIYSILQVPEIVVPRKGLRSRGSRVMLCVVVYLYASSVALWAVDLVAAFENLRYLLMVPGAPLPDRAALADQNMMIVGDSVVIWRVWAIYRQRIWAILIPCLMLLTSFVFGMVTFACLIDPLLGAEQRVCSTMGPISWAFSAAANITCTILIGLKAWYVNMSQCKVNPPTMWTSKQHRKMTRELNILGNPHRMSIEKILSIPVESGFLYCLLWHGYRSPSPHRNVALVYVEEIMRALTNQMTGMYPTLIIVIVDFERTIWGDSPSTISNGTALNTLQLSPRHSRHFVTSLRFAKPRNFDGNSRNGDYSAHHGVMGIDSVPRVAG